MQHAEIWNQEQQLCFQAPLHEYQMKVSGFKTAALFSAVLKSLSLPASEAGKRISLTPSQLHLQKREKTFNTVPGELRGGRIDLCERCWIISSCSLIYNKD